MWLREATDRTKKIKSCSRYVRIFYYYQTPLSFAGITPNNESASLDRKLLKYAFVQIEIVLRYSSTIVLFIDRKDRSKTYELLNT
jgi:hypothetical protein